MPMTKQTVGTAVLDSSMLHIFFFSCGLSRHLGSPQWSAMVLRHRRLPTAIFLSSPSIFMSLFTALYVYTCQNKDFLPSFLPSIHNVLGDLLFRGDFKSIIVMPACSSGRLLTCPNHLNRFSLTLLDYIRHFDRSSCVTILGIVVQCHSTHPPISTSSFHLHVICSPPSWLYPISRHILNY